MQRGDILLYSSSGAVDLLVRLATASTFDHVAIALGDGTMLEALPGGVRVSPVRYGVLWMSGAGWNASAQAVMDASVGKPYGWLNDLAAAFGVGTVDKGEVECAQLANSVLRAMGVKTAGNTPQDVFWAVAQRGGDIRYLEQDDAESTGSQAES